MQLNEKSSPLYDGGDLGYSCQHFLGNILAMTRAIADENLPKQRGYDEGL